MTADRKFIACDPTDLEAVLNKAEDWTVRGSNVGDALARLRADLARAFTVEDVMERLDSVTLDDRGGWYYVRAEWVRGHLARRLSPPVEHKVTLETDDSFWSLCCDCGWSEQHPSIDPFEPARLAREHLAEHGEDR